MKIKKIAVAVIEICCIVCFIALVLTMVLMIAVRNIPFLSIDVMWTDEIGRYLMVYLVFLGSGYAMINGKHMRVDFILDRLKEETRRKIEIVNEILTILFCLIMVGGGFILVQSTGTQAVATLRKYFNMPMAWWNSAVMVGGIIMLAGALGNLILRIRKTHGSEKTSHAQEEV